LVLLVVLCCRVRADQVITLSISQSPSFLRQSTLRESTGDLASYNGDNYHADIKIGDQTFKVVIDTGSGDFAVASSGLVSDVDVSPKYNLGGKNLGRKASYYYADGSSWSGDVYSDTVSFLGVEATSIIFVAISKQKDFFDSNTKQGILGLSFPGSAVDEPTLLSQLVAAGVLTRNVVSIQMCRDGTKGSGHIVLGGNDPSYFKGSLQYMSLFSVDNELTRAATSNGRKFYTIAVNSASVGNGPSIPLGTNKTIGTIPPTANGMIVDSGTNFLIFPAPLFQAVVQRLSAISGLPEKSFDVTSGFPVVCGTDPSKYPDITLTVVAPSNSTTTVVTIPASKYTYNQGHSDLCGGNALGVLIAKGQGAPYGVLGQPFLLQYYVEFDKDNLQLGVAPSTNCPSSSNHLPLPLPVIITIVVAVTLIIVALLWYFYPKLRNLRRKDSVGTTLLQVRSASATN